MPKQVRNDPILSYFWRRLYRYDQNVLLIVCGQTGSCKSGSAIAIADMMDRGVDGRRRFNLDRVVFKANNFVDLVRSNMPKGSVIIWDEIGVEHDSRNYYTTKNKLIKYVMQTFRYKNFMLIMTVPNLKSIDIGTRRLIHCYLEMQGPDHSRKHATGFFRFVQVNPRSGKEYFKSSRYFNSKGKRSMGSYKIPKPSIDIEGPYKAKKQDVTEQWYENFNEQLTYMQDVIGEKHERKQTTLIPVKGLAEKLYDDLDEAYDQKKGRFTGPLVQAVLTQKDIEVSQVKALSVATYLTQIMKKGIIEVGIIPQ